MINRNFYTTSNIYDDKVVGNKKIYKNKETLYKDSYYINKKNFFRYQEIRIIIDMADKEIIVV